MFERHAPAALAGRLLHLARLWWSAPRKERAAAPSLDTLNDHLRRDIGLAPDDGAHSRQARYPLNWPWQRF